MLIISNNRITRVITVKYSIASPPNIKVKGFIPLALTREQPPTAYLVALREQILRRYYKIYVLFCQSIIMFSTQKIRAGKY